MQLLIDATDLRDAPGDVRTWILGRIAPPANYKVVEPSIPEVGTPYPPETTPAEADKPEPANAKREEPVTLVDIQTRATELIQSKGKEVAKQVLAKLGIKKFTDCPPEKMADCLAEIAKAL